MSKPPSNRLIEDILTPEILFAQPGLRPTLPSQFKFSPDGHHVTYLQGTEDAPTTLDLWHFDRINNEHQPLVRAADLNAQADESVTELSDAERAERERKRQFTFGISHYQWLGHEPSLAVYADGQAYWIDISAEGDAPMRITPEDHRHSGFNPSPSGNLMSYVRDGNLFYRALHPASDEVVVTEDADECVSNGLPDFLAAEEMHRFDGAWWSACERYLIYCRNDESPVAVSHRLEIDGNGSRTIAQRYPYAGAVNPRVTLHVYDRENQTSSQIWQSENASDDCYLARVDPVEGGVCLQTQDRLQQTLSLKYYRFDDGLWQPLYQETSETWINLTDDLRQLANGDLLFSSEDQGQRQAVILESDGGRRRLAGPAHINQILGSSQRVATATGWDESPIENHLFEIALDGSGYRQLTRGTGVHDIVMHRDQAIFIDRYSDETMPMKITVEELNPARSQTVYEETISDGHRYAAYSKHHVTPRFGSIEAAGHTLHYRLTPPAQIHGQHPTIVYVYGGPGAQKVRRDWGSLLVQLFAQRGYGVLELDNRGSTNRGSAFEAGLYKRMGSIEVDDQVLGTQILHNETWADPERIGVFGHSYGGYMTLMCLAQAGHCFKAGVAVAPVADWRLYDSHYTERFMGLPADNEEAYKQSSVIPHLVNLERPLLLMHGMADDNVLFTHSTMLMSELQTLGKSFELMTYPGAKHSMQEAHVSIHRFHTLLDFFDREL